VEKVVNPPRNPVVNPNRNSGLRPDQWLKAAIASPMR
jgi:hypothetical protein